jgi:hypothetical protein
VRELLRTAEQVGSAGRPRKPAWRARHVPWQNKKDIRTPRRSGRASTAFLQEVAQEPHAEKITGGAAVLFAHAASSRTAAQSFGVIATPEPRQRDKIDLLVLHQVGDEEVSSSAAGSFTWCCSTAAFISSEGFNAGRARSRHPSHRTPGLSGEIVSVGSSGRGVHSGAESNEATWAMAAGQVEPGRLINCAIAAWRAGSLR